MNEKLSVQDLIDLLLAVEDKTLPIAIREATDEYWGSMFGKPWVAKIKKLQINGPKEPSVDCFYIGQD